MKHNASWLWIFLQCAAACFSFILGENAVLKGKARLGVYCSSIPDMINMRLAALESWGCVGAYSASNVNWVKYAGYEFFLQKGGNE